MKPKLLLIGHVWPESKTTAAGQHMLQLLHCFATNRYAITFCSTSVKTQYSDQLGLFGIEEVQIKLNHSSFDELAEKIAPQLVIFDRFMVEEQFGWRVAEACPNALRVLNTEDLHSLREYRQECHKKTKEFQAEEWLVEDKTKREIASIYRCDLSLLTSTFEMELLQRHFPIPSDYLLHLPFMLEELDQNTIAAWPSFAERRDFITFGNGKHAPNVDSILHLKNTIWPLLKTRLPMAKLHIYGAYLPSSILQLHNEHERFLVHGWVDDLSGEVKKARVVLAPLRFGAGIKGKLLMAMQSGTPNVTTVIGAEGMQRGLEWAGAIAKNPEEFSKKAVALYNDSERWLQAQRNGIHIINTNFSKKRLQKRLLDTIDSINMNLKGHRNRNIVGNLLRQQQYAATKYMGKWIEEKQRNRR